MRDDSDPAEFPRPTRLAQKCARWRLSDLERFEAARRGLPEPAPRSGDTERFLTAEEVSARYSVAKPTPWRWAKEGAPKGAQHRPERKVPA